MYVNPRNSLFPYKSYSGKCACILSLTVDRTCHRKLSCAVEFGQRDNFLIIIINNNIVIIIYSRRKIKNMQDAEVAF